MTPIALSTQQARRNARFDEKAERKPDPYRTKSQRDRDRILYTSAFQRLAEVTQVVAADEAYVFHNRLTHSLKVAQVARRIAEKLLRTQRGTAKEIGGSIPMSLRLPLWPTIWDIRRSGILPRKPLMSLRETKVSLTGSRGMLKVFESWQRSRRDRQAEPDWT